MARHYGYSIAELRKLTIEQFTILHQQAVLHEQRERILQRMPLYASQDSINDAQRVLRELDESENHINSNFYRKTKRQMIEEVKKVLNKFAMWFGLRGKS